MEDFTGKLLSFPKWQEKEFTIDQLKQHLIECLELLESGDEHLYAELIDLIQITKVCLRQNLKPDDINDLYEKRFDKFMSKLNL